MQGELSPPRRRVIIGSLWSTWRLRAQRKQWSLHPTLDCLSQQTPFPSPPPVFAKLPPRHNLPTAHKTTERDTGIHSVITSDTCLSASAFTLSFSRTGPVSCQWLHSQAKVPSLTGATVHVDKPVRQDEDSSQCSAVPILTVGRQQYTSLLFVRWFNA